MTRNLAMGILLLLGVTSAAQARVLPSVTSKAPPIEADRPADVPSDAQLERAKARIGQIRFRPVQLFDTALPEEDTSLFRLANRLHILTREQTIRDRLLFKQGDLYAARVLHESERLLRATRYLRDARIRPVSFHDGEVDVEVVTQDVWTLNPGISFGRKGGKNTSGFELEELNLLGLGTQLSVGVKSNVDRTSTTFAYRDPQLGTSWWNLFTSYSQNSDGQRADFALDHPFYAFDTKFAGGAFFHDERRLDKRYDLGAPIDAFAHDARLATAYWGRSAGLRAGWVRRFSTGITLDEQQFHPVSDPLPTQLLPINRKFVYPWIAIEVLNDEFRTERNRDQIEKTEDYALGLRARAQLGYASTALSSSSNAWTYDARVSKGFELASRDTLMLSANSMGRLEDSRLAGTLTSAELRYYRRQSAHRLLFATLATTVGTNLDLDQQILLGGDSGLRGYPLRYQAGTSRWLFTAEQRYFSNWYPFRLFNVGAAAFFDIGQVSGHDPLSAAPQGVLKDVGFGLRLGANRSAQGNVLHIDVAVPLDGAGSIKKLQFVVETKRNF